MKKENFMKTIIATVMMFSSLSAFADAVLSPGQSININGLDVICVDKSATNEFVKFTAKSNQTLPNCLSIARLLNKFSKPRNFILIPRCNSWWGGSELEIKVGGMKSGEVVTLNADISKAYGSSNSSLYGVANELFNSLTSETGAITYNAEDRTRAELTVTLY